MCRQDSFHVLWVGLHLNCAQKTFISGAFYTRCTVRVILLKKTVLKVLLNASHVKTPGRPNTHSKPVSGGGAQVSGS